MKLNQLPKTSSKPQKRIGRGYGSGKGGHASSRGQKGQKSRGKVGQLFEGTKMRKSLIKRMPFLRGKGKLKPTNYKPEIINLKYLDLLPEGSKVDIATLVKYNLVNKDAAQRNGVKILGEGDVSKPFIVKVKISNPALKKIIKAGGKLEKDTQPQPDEKIETTPAKKKAATKKKITTK